MLEFPAAWLFDRGRRQFAHQLSQQLRQLFVDHSRVDGVGAAALRKALAMDFDQAADELYELLPSEFVPRRKELAAKATTEVRKAISGLRRPTLAAFALNLLVREKPDEIMGLALLGEALREPQAASSPKFREMLRQRHEIVGTLATEARALAVSRGAEITDHSFREIQATLNIALASPDAAELVSSGHLVTALGIEGSGIDLTDLGVASAPRSRPSTPKPRAPRETDATKEIREATRQALGEIKEEERVAERALAGAIEELERLSERRDKQEARVKELTGKLADERKTLQEAESQVHRAKVRMRNKEADYKKATSAAAKAQAAVDRLT